MGLVILLFVLAIIFGVVGLVVHALAWLLVIGLVLLVVALIRGFTAGRSSRV